MHRKEMTLQPDSDRPSDQTSHCKKVKSRVTSLTPYIVQIQRRKKLRQLAKQSRKNLNQSSSRSFRIKDKSLTSLHKETISRTKDVHANSVVSKLIEQRGNKNNRTKSLQRQRNLNCSKTLDNKVKAQQNTNNFFDELYSKVKNKVQREKSSRKRQYQTLDGPRSRSQQSGTINIKKIAYTNSVEITACQAESKKHVKKGNFRKNKFEYSSSCVQNKAPSRIEKQYVQSDSKLQLDKKESNVSINKEMDKIALRQMKQHQQVRNKQFHRSVQKDNDKYFSYQSYRPAKSKNDIQVILSTAKYPSMHKVSHSTTDAPQPLPQNHAEGLPYDFSFPNQSQTFIKQIENASEEESVKQLGGQTLFIERGTIGIREGVNEWQDGLQC